LSAISPAALDRVALRDLIQRRVDPAPSERPLRGWRSRHASDAVPIASVPIASVPIASVEVQSRPPVPAAVLMPIIDRPEGLSVLLTRRSAHLPHHAGQISFPGGRLEAGDADVIATALRETEEEIGLARRFVSIVGFLPDHLIPVSGYRVTPVVSFIEPGFRLTPDPMEVAEAFEVPLGFLLDPTNHVPRVREFGGVAVEFIDMPFGPHHIWGATAGMLYTLYRLLCGEELAA
jgi:8-oxo-dGTP pyrophosphatase MutT (NUDIX family)